MGSPKPAGGTSAALGEHLLQGLEERGWVCISLHALRALREGVVGKDRLVEAVRSADLVVLSFPVYVDGLPGSFVEALEVVAAGVGERPPGRLAAIAQCGFPEAVHTEVALQMCRLAAREIGLGWAGGLGIGGGGMIDGRPLSQARGAVRKVMSALDLAAAALARGEDVPEEVVALAARPLVPAWVYRRAGDHNWRRQAKKAGARGLLGHRPFADGGR